MGPIVRALSDANREDVLGGGGALSQNEYSSYGFFIRNTLLNLLV